MKTVPEILAEIDKLIKRENYSYEILGENPSDSPAIRDLLHLKKFILSGEEFQHDWFPYGMVSRKCQRCGAIK